MNAKLPGLIKSSLYLMPVNMLSLCLCDNLRRHGYPVAGLLDNDFSKIGQHYCDCPILHPEDIDGQSAVVIITSGSFQSELRAQLNSLHIDSVFFVTDILTASDRKELMDIAVSIDPIYAKLVMPIYSDLTTHQSLKLLFRNLPPLTASTVNIPQLELRISDRCNLRCKNCANWMQYFDKPSHYALDEIIAGIDNLFRLGVTAGIVVVMGGETLLHPDLPRIIGHLLTYENFHMVDIVTNGTIVPGKKLLEVLKNPRAGVSISNYGNIVKNKPHVIKALTSAGINFDEVPYASWIDINTLSDFTDDSTASERFSQCTYSVRTLAGNMLGFCEPVISALRLHALPEENLRDGDFLDVSHCNIEEISDYLDRKKFLNTCRICTGRPLDVKMIEPAIQAKSPLPYKSYD